MKISLHKSLALILLMVAFCASCSFPSETPVATDKDVEPTSSKDGTHAAPTPMKTLESTAVPFPTSESSLEISFENVNRIKTQVAIQEEPGWILGLAFSPDGTLLAGAANHKDVNVWSVEDGSLARTLSGHTSIIRSVAFSPDGRFLASGSQDTTIILWRVSDWTPVMTLEGHESYVNSLAFSPDGRLLASGGEDRRVIVWEVETGVLIDRFEEPILRVENVAFSPDGQWIAAASAENRASVWSVETGEVLWTLLGPNPIYRLAFSPDSSMLATGSWSVVPFSGEPTGPIIFWDLSDGSQLRTTTEMTVAYSLAFSSDGTLLFSGAEKNFSVHVWRVADGALLWELMGHQDKITAVDMSADGTRIASGDQSGEILLWWLPDN